MQSKLEILSKEILHKKLNGIPEKHRHKFVTLIKETQENIKHKSYQSEVGEGLLNLTIRNDGTIKDLKLDDSLFVLYSNHQELADVISSLLITAHEQAVLDAKKDLNLEITELENKIYSLSRDMSAEIRNK